VPELDDGSVGIPHVEGGAVTLGTEPGDRTLDDLAPVRLGQSLRSVGSRTKQM